MFDTPQGRERVARLEERSDSHRQQIEKVFCVLDEIDAKVERILKMQNRQLGFLSGIAFSFGLIGAAVGAMGTEVLKKIFS